MASGMMSSDALSGTAAAGNAFKAGPVGAKVDGVSEGEADLVTGIVTPVAGRSLVPEPSPENSWIAANTPIASTTTAPAAKASRRRVCGGTGFLVGFGRRPAG